MKTNMNLKCFLIVFSLIFGYSVTNAQKAENKKSGKEKTEKKTETKKVEERCQISVADVVGSDEEVGIDIRELDVAVEVPYKIEEPESIFDIVEQMPQFEGGEGALMKFIASNLSYPVDAQEIGIQGRIIVRFVVNKEGKVVDPRIMRGIHPSCDKEALRVVSMLPDWMPGMQNGQRVSTYFTLPLVFKLTDPEPEKTSENNSESNTESN